MTDRWEVGEAPSRLCATDRHEECASSTNCTCRCHYMNGPGLEPVPEP